MNMRLCNRCNRELKLIDRKKMGYRCIYLTLFAFPFLMLIAWNTIAPYLVLIINLTIGYRYAQREDRYYYCKKCKEKTPSHG